MLFLNLFWYFFSPKTWNVHVVKEVSTQCTKFSKIWLFCPQCLLICFSEIYLVLFGLFIATSTTWQKHSWHRLSAIEMYLSVDINKFMQELLVRQKDTEHYFHLHFILIWCNRSILNLQSFTKYLRQSSSFHVK